MGTMHFWDLTIGIATTVSVVLAVGVSVDYASHIGHMFMLISGSRLGKPVVFVLILISIFDFTEKGAALNPITLVGFGNKSEF